MALLREDQAVGRWTVTRFIDRGGNGEVWEVVDEDGRPAALKILMNNRPDAAPFQRFAREVDTVRALGEQPGIMPILDVHIPDEPGKKDRAWYVMPLAEPLEVALAGRPVAEVITAVAHVADTLSGLHEQGIAHRDLKPGNLLWLDGRPVVGDFGLVHLPDAQGLTETGRVPGSFGYIADEVMVDPRAAEAPPADVFALAKVLWKLLTDGATFPPQGALRADGGGRTVCSAA